MRQASTVAAGGEAATIAAAAEDSDSESDEEDNVQYHDSKSSKPIVMVQSGMEGGWQCTPSTLTTVSLTRIKIIHSPSSDVAGTHLR